MKNNYIYDKNIWITGASSGIGLEITKLLAKYTANLIVSSSNLQKLQSAMSSIAGNAKIFAFPVDLANAKSIIECFEFISSEVGFPNILINNAGIYTPKSFINMTIGDFENMMNVNLRGAFLATQCVLPAMLESGGGAIVNIASITAVREYPHSSIYAASKAGLLAMMRSLREEVRDRGIKIINVIPGATATNIWDEDFLECKRNKMSSPVDIAKTVVSALTLCDSYTSMVEEITIRPHSSHL